MYSNGPRIAGRALIPLPFESSLSVLWRLGWRNCLRSAQIKRLFSDRGGYPTTGSIINSSWLSTAKVHALTGWNLPSAEELRFANAFSNDINIWTISLLRYCPLCLEIGFHSFLHQLDGISCCPLHRIALEIRCQFCKKHLPYYRHAPDVYDHPYVCACGQPISGVLPDLNLDEMLRLQRNSIEEAFGPIMHWWCSSKTIRSEAAKFSKDFIYSSDELRQWCDVGSFMRSMTLLRTQPPDCFDVPRINSITISSWRIRVCTEDIRGGTWKRRDWNERVRTPSPVYKCILRRLRTWICRHEKLTVREFEEELSSGFSKLRISRPRLLAYICLRFQLEGRWNSRFVQLHDEPKIGLLSYAGRTPRAAWRAAFLAIYATWFLRILNLKDKSVKSLGYWEGSERSALLSWNSIVVDEQGQSWWEGATALPTIDDLHLLASVRLTQVQ